MIRKKAIRLLNETGDFPNFLVKTTLSCSIVVIIIVVPFAINNFIHHRLMLGFAASSVTMVCAINAWYGIRGKYNLLVNTYIVSPTSAVTVIYTIFQLNNSGSYWPFLMVLAYYFILPEKRAWFFNALTVLIIIPVSLSVLEQSMAVRFSAVIVGVSLFAFLSMREINVLNGRLKEQAITDQLTGLFNRSQLEHSLNQAISQNQRSGVPMALIIFDIDHFKSINDTKGHDVGDMVLKALSDLLRRHTRGSDITFRLGGDEFLILIYNTDEHQSMNVAENLRKQVEQANLFQDLRVTISGGVSSLQEGMEAATWVKACDQKLYRAKEGGRNRVVV